MKRCAILVLLLAGPVAAQDKDFTPLFNGKNLDGWQPKLGGKLEDWSVKDGVLVGKAGRGWLATTKMYGDYVLRVTWKLPTKNGNSGVFLRVPDVEAKISPSNYAMEIQILDDDGASYRKLKPYQYSGSLYHFFPRAKAMYKPGDWNTFEITCRGDKVIVVYNGAKVVDADMTKFPELAKRPRRGLIGLQNHGSAVEFREVAIKVSSQ
ncbi:MAG: DUF1080 domain-containing protein [Gemmataceae bacterium]|nr:DUF1080 domain-containing protein [Gemmataceae bacterium]